MLKPRTALPDARISPRFAGVCTFCRYPRLEDVEPDCRPVDWAIYGAPFDGGVTYRPGARFGPRAVREQSQYVKRYSIEHDLDVCERLSMADAGDSPVSPYSCEHNTRAQLEFARSLGDGAKTRLMAVGGDHTIAYANIAATWERCGRPKGGMPLVHFDSHLDTVDQVWGEKWGHASVFRRAIEDGIVNPRKMISIGVKGPLNSGDDLKFAKAHGIRVIGCEAYRAATRGGNTLRGPMPAFVRSLRDEPAYITFDIDCVDPAFAPGTGTPSVGGFSSSEALGALRSLAGMKVAGADVVEVLPDRDVAGITALLAAHVMFEILCLDAVSRRATRGAGKPRTGAAHPKRSSKQTQG